MERTNLGQHEYIHIINEPDANGINQDCDTNYPKITLWDSSGVVIVDAATMTKQDTGEYIYQPSITTTRPKGSWPWKVELQTSSKVSFRNGTFEVL